MPRMMRGAPVVLLLCASRVAAADPDAGAVGEGAEVVVVDEDAPRREVQQLTLDAAAEIGVLARSYTTLTVGYARRLWCERAYVEARLGAGVAQGFTVFEVRVGAGLAFRPSERVDLLVGWRIGDTHLRGSLFKDLGLGFGREPLTIHLLAVEIAIAIQVQIAGAWRLRALPLVPAVLWNGTYAATLGLELGVGRAF